MESTAAPLILGIESSCDDTSAAVIRGPKVLSNVVANQALHAEYGGVVPEWASRAHLSKIEPVVRAALAKSKIDPTELDAIAYTLGPGLQGSLHVGVAFAKAFAWFGHPGNPGSSHARTHPCACIGAKTGSHLPVSVSHSQRRTYSIGPRRQRSVDGGFRPNIG